METLWSQKKFFLIWRNKNTFFKKLFFDWILDRKRRGERARRREICCYTYLCILWLIPACAHILGIEPSTLAYQDNAPTKWATQPGWNKHSSDNEPSNQTVLPVKTIYIKIFFYHLLHITWVLIKPTLCNEQLWLLAKLIERRELWPAAKHIHEWQEKLAAGVPLAINIFY